MLCILEGKTASKWDIFEYLIASPALSNRYLSVT